MPFIVNPKTFKIVVIEDDSAIQLMYSFKLEHEGFQIKTASNGREGLEVIEAFRPDLILLDLKMPIMKGDDMLAELRQKSWGQYIRVIILTNLSRSEAPQSLGLLKVDRYIVKAHYTPRQALETIKEVLGI